MQTKVIVFLLLVGLPVATQENQHRAPTSKEEIQKSFDSAAYEFLRSIRTGDIGVFKDFLPSKGVVFGHEQPITSKAQIVADLNNKKGIYCGFFDGNCTDREYEEVTGRRPITHLPSDRELLLEPGALSIKTEVLDPNRNGSWWGTITLTRSRPVQEQPTYEYFDFYFSENRWFLVVNWSE